MVASRRTGFALLVVALVLSTEANAAGQSGVDGSQSKTVIQHDPEVAVSQPGPAGGVGTTTGHLFFVDVPGFKTVFRKRVMHKGSTVGYRPQRMDEIFYILSGTGELNVNGVLQTVTAGTAILKRPGNSYGLRVIGDDELVMIVTFQMVEAAQ